MIKLFQQNDSEWEIKLLYLKESPHAIKLWYHNDSQVAIKLLRRKESPDSN